MEMKKIIFFLAILIVLSSCTHNKLSIEKVEKTPENVQVEMDKLIKNEIAGGYFLIQSDKKQYLYVQDDRRNRSLLANDVTDATISQKDSKITIELTTKQNNLEEVKNRDALYEITNSDKTEELTLNVNGDHQDIDSIITLE